MADGSGQIPDSILDDQRQAWIDGRAPTIEELLQATPFQDHPDAQLDLLYNEIVVKEELGLKPVLEDYLNRYPQLKQELSLHFEIHRAINDQVLADTANHVSEKTWHDPDRSIASSHASPENYDVMRELGHGGMAIVHLARHRQLRRSVALKMFQPGRFLSKRDVHRIWTEAEAMARLDHPNIVQIFEIGECQGAPFLSLELAEQGTLAQQLQQFPYTVDAAVKLVEVLARALHHAHERQVIHRDLKPANVLFTRDGTPKITDFGLAKVFQECDVLSSDATRTGETMGTPRYMAPEQAAGEHSAVGPATDVYALGNLLYECLTGRAPFVSASVVETLKQIREDDPLPLRKLQPSIPVDVETICLRCLQKEPKRRYSSAADLADDLRRFLDHRPILARPTPPWERMWKWCRRRPIHAVSIAAVVLFAFSSVTAVVARDRAELRRISNLREEVATLMNEGRDALEQDELDVAQARFQSAWLKVQAEPALADHQTSVAGWLDHARNAANRYQWKQRVPPRDFDQRRDEALLASSLILPYVNHSEQLARTSIRQALELTIPDDSAWDREREQLTLLEIDMTARESGAAEALKQLASINEFSSRRFYEYKASLLDELGNATESSDARQQASQHPRRKTVEDFHAGINHLRRLTFRQAIDDFERVLEVEPEHFMARLFEAICFLELKRFDEAKIALTACIAQRPRFQWNYYFRGLVAKSTGDRTGAIQHFQRALDGRCSDLQSFVTLIELGRMNFTRGDWLDAHDAFFRANTFLPDESSAAFHLAAVNLLYAMPIEEVATLSSECRFSQPVVVTVFSQSNTFRSLKRLSRSEWFEETIRDVLINRLNVLRGSTSPSEPAATHSLFSKE